MGRRTKGKRTAKYRTVAVMWVHQILRKDEDSSERKTAVNGRQR